ncbi:uncharacterized protein VTP21DRAFT_5918 [Calcarisporiella thermophila]|uniref:uncharacterized protein n=1 Tax=Calcarisporiella thermophila TaxID=911321 RepID=UPI00374210E8
MEKKQALDSKVSLNAAKQSIVLASDLVAKLRTLRNQLTESDSQELWQINRKEIAQLKKRLNECFIPFNDERIMKRLYRKIKKIRRHKIWYTRRRKIRQAQREANRKLIDQWIIETRTKENEAMRLKALEKERETQKRITANRERRTMVLLKKIEKLKKLKALRRERSKREGHFFPEEDDEFFFRVQLLSEQMRPREDENEQQPNEESRHNMVGIAKNTKNDDAPSDTAATFWLQAEANFDNLVMIRRQWDSYLVPFDDPLGTGIPPRFIDPAPPSSESWAAYLEP